MTQRESQITTIYPIAGGNGAAYMTLQLAYALREVEKHKKIAVVDFDFNSPVLGEGLHEDDVHGIDMLVDKMNGNLLTNSSFLENMIKLKKEIHLLRGSQLSHRFPFVSKEHLDGIVALLKEEYDYIFIATGDNASDGAVPTALFHADHLLVVGRYTQKNKWRLKEAVNCVSTYAQTQDVAVAYNMYEDQNKLDFSKQLPSHWKVAGIVPYNPLSIDSKNVVSSGGFPLGKGKKSEGAKETLGELIQQYFQLGGGKKK